MESEGDDEESADSEDGSGDAMAEDGDADADADADMDADSSGAEEMEDLAGDEARAGRAAMAAGAAGSPATGLPGRILSAASEQSQNIQPVVLPTSSGAAVAPVGGSGVAAAALGGVNCGVSSDVPAAPPAIV